MFQFLFVVTVNLLNKLLNLNCFSFFSLLQNKNLAKQISIRVLVSFRCYAPSSQSYTVTVNVLVSFRCYSIFCSTSPTCKWFQFLFVVTSAHSKEDKQVQCFSFFSLLQEVPFVLRPRFSVLVSFRCYTKPPASFMLWTLFQFLFVVTELLEKIRDDVAVLVSFRCYHCI